MKILIIEDHEDSANALCSLLKKKMVNVECVIAGTLSEGLALAKTITPDITLLDLGLPRVSIEEVIESIPLFPPPVICLTDMNDPDSSIEKMCWENLAQNFFSKKFLRSLLYEHIGDKLVESITKANWRRKLPTDAARKLHQACQTNENLHEQSR